VKVRIDFNHVTLWEKDQLINIQSTMNYHCTEYYKVDAFFFSHKGQTQIACSGQMAIAGEAGISGWQWC